MNLTILDDFFLECEQKDYALYKHLERVSMLAYATAQELQLSSKELEIAYISGLLHDIGKFHSLTELEHYSTVSATIVNSLKEFENIPNIILQIEETYDGEGYPLGLKEDEISLLSYIIIICNFYDELRMLGKTHNEATHELKSNSKVLFPDQIIEPFIISVEKNNLDKEYGE
jgi:putative nucleotidyltransferase with HDIG domain